MADSEIRSMGLFSMRASDLRGQFREAFNEVRALHRSGALSQIGDASRIFYAKIYPGQQYLYDLAPFKVRAYYSTIAQAAMEALDNPEFNYPPDFESTDLGGSPAVGS